MQSIRLGDLDYWTEIGKGVYFPEKKRRKITFKCNSSEQTELAWDGDDGTKKFLAHFTGLASVTFEVKGSGTIKQKGGKAFWKATEADHRHVELIDDPEIFTKVKERRTRNPELEMMMHKMHLNNERRMRNMEGLHEKRIAQAERRAIQQLQARSPGTSDQGDRQPGSQEPATGPGETGNLSEEASG